MENNFEKFTLLWGAKVGIRPWRMKHKKEFLLALGDDEKINFKNALDILLNYSIEKIDTVKNKISEADYLKYFFAQITIHFAMGVHNFWNNIPIF